GGRSRVFQVNPGVTASLSGLTITGGSAFNGGGLSNSDGTTSLTNCTVSGNSASNNGGGPANLRSHNNRELTLTNTIVAGNHSGGDLYGNISGSNNLTGVADPGLAPLGDYGGPTQTMPLLPGSPALNAGTTGPGIPATDQRGTARDAQPDIGAVEVAAATHFAVSGFPSTTTAGDAH